MLKISLAYLGGALTMATVVYSAGGHASALTFMAGAASVLVVLVAVLASQARLRRLVRMLGRLLEAFSDAPPPQDRRTAREVSVGDDDRFYDLVAALTQLGARRAAASLAAKRAIAAKPTGTFQELFIEAVQFTRAAAA